MAVTQLLEPLMDTLEGIRMPTRFIHLDRMPRDEEGVAELHQALQKCQDGPLTNEIPRPVVLVSSVLLLLLIS